MSDPEYVTNKQLYDELRGVDENIDRLVTPLRVAVGILIPMSTLSTWKIFGSPSPVAPAEALLHLVFG